MTSEDAARIACDDCNWRGMAKETVQLRNPLEAADVIHVCPHCYGIKSTLTRLCDEAGCTQEADSGTPFPGGYKRHCYKHPPITEAGAA